MGYWTKSDYINDILEVFTDEETWDENSPLLALKEREIVIKGLKKLNRNELIVLWHQIINCPGIKESKRDELIKSWIKEKKGD